MSQEGTHRHSHPFEGSLILQADPREEEMPEGEDRPEEEEEEDHQEEIREQEEISMTD